MPSLASALTTLVCLVAATNAIPFVTPRTQGECVALAKGTNHAPSAKYNVFPGAPDVGKESLGFHVETFQNASQVEQILVFSDIPAGTKNCQIGWQQGSRVERVFIVRGGDALAGVRLLSGFPHKSSVTYNSVKPFVDAGKDVGAADFTNWDDLPPQGHLVGDVDCAETMYLLFALRNSNGNTKVFLNQDDENGVYVSYNCQ